MAITHDGSVQRIKKLGFYANRVLSALVFGLLVIAIIYWIYEEVALKDAYLSNVFLNGDPTFREARMILLIGYLITIAFLCMIQCCIQIAKDPHHQHIGPRRMVWCLAATLTILMFVAAAALAVAFKGGALLLLEENMLHNITNKDYYSNFSAGEFSSTGNGFNTIQRRLECCGVHGKDDYATFKEMYNLTVPYSCCPTSGDVIVTDDVTSCQTGNGSSIYSSGCYVELVTMTAGLCQEIIILAAIAATTIFVVTLLRLTLGHYYQKHKEKKQYEEVRTVAVNPRNADNNDQITSI